MLYIGLFNHITLEHEWSLLTGTPSVSWHSVISDGSGQKVSASDSNSCLYKLNFPHTAKRHAEMACEYTYNQILSTPQSSCLTSAASLIGVSSPYTPLDFCQKLIS